MVGFKKITNWDTELNNVFGEVVSYLKKELTDYFTSDMKAKYLEYEKVRNKYVKG